PIISTPAATADTGNAAPACDFSQSVPIYSGRDETPSDETAVSVTSDGDLILTCPEESQPVILARNVTDASATNAPGVVQTKTRHEQKWDRALINIVTGES